MEKNSLTGKPTKVQDKEGNEYTLSSEATGAFLKKQKDGTYKFYLEFSTTKITKAEVDPF